MTTLLRRTTESTCNLEDEPISQNGTYSVASGKDTVVSATGNIILNYTSLTNEFPNEISPQNIALNQAIEVYGFTSEIVSTDSQTCPNNDVTVLDAGITLSILLIDVTAFGIYEFAQLVFVTLLADSPDSALTPSTLIELEGSEQTILLHNVTQSALDESNFIFATDTNSASATIQGGYTAVAFGLLLGCYMLLE